MRRIALVSYALAPPRGRMRYISQVLLRFHFHRLAYTIAVIVGLPISRSAHHNRQSVAPVG